MADWDNRLEFESLADWDNRLEFESYLYDYLIKRNMYETAELFRNEVNLPLDRVIPRRIDVPEGFLLEWWSGSYEFAYFREALQLNENRNLQAPQGLGASQEEEQYPMIEEPENEPSSDSTSTMSRENNSMELDEIGEVSLLYFPSSYKEMYGDLPQLLLPPSHEEVNGELPQPFSTSSHQEELQTSMLNSNIVAKASSGQNVESLHQNTSKSENTAISEDSDPMIEILINSFWLFEQGQPELFGKST